MGKQWKQWQTLFLGVSKITADGDCSHEIKRRLLLGRKVMTNLDSILKSETLLSSKGLSSQSYIFFPVVIYGCESWTIKKAECQRIDAFELWCWRRLLRVPWTARRSNQSILKKISPEYSLEGLMLKWKLQSFGHLMQRTDSFAKTLMLGKIESGGRNGWQRMRWLDGITDSMDVSFSTLCVSDGQGNLVCWIPWSHKESDMIEWLNWTELKYCCWIAKFCWNFLTPWIGAHFLPCPSLSPGVCLNSCPLSQWCYLTISTSATTSSSCPQTFPASEPYPVCWLFILFSQSIKASALVLPMNFLQYWLVWFPFCPRDSQEILQHHGSKASILQCSDFFIVQLSHLYMTTEKTIVLTLGTFVSKVISLFVIHCLGLS